MTVEIKLTRGYVAIVDKEDADLGNFRWSALIRGNQVHAQRYVAINGKPTCFYMHRVILERIVGRPLETKEYCDHINVNGLDNQRANLRIASPAENTRNMGLRSDNASGYRGVCFANRKNKWLTQISINGKPSFVGHFNDPLEAHRAYCIASLIHHGEYGNFGSNSPFAGMTLEQLQAPVIQLALPLQDAA